MIWFTSANGQNLQSALRQIYDSYNIAMDDGSFDKIISFYTSGVQKEITSQVKTKKEKKGFLDLGKIQIPESYEILHMESDKDTQSITLHTIMQFSEMKNIKRERHGRNNS